MSRHSIPTVLTIAGSDPCSGAGVQLDLRVFQRLGVYGLTVVTAVTAQNTEGIQKINKVPPRIVAAQIDSVARDTGEDACKIGMLYSPTTIEAVADRIKRRSIPNVVMDPMITAKDGTLLLLTAAIKRMKRHLIPLVHVLTPNAHEAQILTGIQVRSLGDLKEAARAIKDMGCAYVLAKGGHLEAEPTDVLFDGESFLDLPGVRIEGTPVHGTGCAFSAAMTARIALGDSVPTAAQFAKDFVTEAIRSAAKMGKGSRLIVL